MSAGATLTDSSKRLVRQASIPRAVARRVTKLVLLPGWGTVTFSTMAAACLSPAIAFGLLVAVRQGNSAYIRIYVGGMAVIYVCFWIVDVVDRHSHPDFVDCTEVFIGDAMPDRADAHHPRDLSTADVTGVLVHQAEHHCVVAVTTANVGEELVRTAVFDLDATRRRNTRRGRRTTSLMAANVAAIIDRPVLGIYA